MHNEWNRYIDLPDSKEKMMMNCQPVMFSSAAIAAMTIIVEVLSMKLKPSTTGTHFPQNANSNLTAELNVNRNWFLKDRRRVVAKMY